MSRSTKQAVAGLGVMVALLAGIAFLAMRGNAERGLRADVLSTRRAEPGEAVAVRISARDTLGGVERVEVDFGDGTDPVVEEHDPEVGCGSDFGRTETYDFDHTYVDRGVFTVRATVTSSGCDAAVEEVVAVRTIEVKPLRRG